jgi:hypothetical protein
MMSSASTPNLHADVEDVPETTTTEIQNDAPLLSALPESKAPTPPRSKSHKKTPSSLPPEISKTSINSSLASKTPKGLTPTQARRHKLQMGVLHSLEKKKAKEGVTFGYYNSRFRGLGGNVSLFSKEYRKHLGLDGKTLQAKDLEEQAANNSLTDPFASDEAKEEVRML